MEYILPLIGVLIGWILKEISTAISGLFQYKQRLSFAITNFLYMCQEMIIIRQQLSDLKILYSDPPSYEEGRKRALNKYTIKTKSFEQNLEESLIIISEGFPVEAVRLRKIFEDYNSFKELDFTTSAKVSKIYETNIELFNKAFLQYSKELEKIILHFSWSLGLKTHYKIKVNIDFLNGYNTKKCTFNGEQFFRDVNDKISNQLEE